MGQGMAKNIITKKSKQLLFSVYDINSANTKTLTGDVHVSPTISDLTSRSDVIALSLPSAAAQDAVLFGPEGIMQSVIKQERFTPLTIIDHGTFPHATVLKSHATLAQQGITYIDAPVSGGPAGASAGTLSIMLGCSAAQLSTLAPLLGFYATSLTRFGGVGTGMAAKIINQLLVGVHAQAACEALALAEKMKLDVFLLQQMLGSSWGQSRYVCVFFRYSTAI